MWKALAVNPKPVEDAGNGLDKRNWVALNSNGIMLVSHGLKVPTDTSNQVNRPWNGGGSAAPGSWAQPRWGWPEATTKAYPADVGQDLMIYDWTPGDLKGYVLDNFGALWPFGSDTPIAATGVTGAPFGFFPLGDGTQYYSHFAMHSANGLPFGLGGYPDGFGYMLGFDGGVKDNGVRNWGGPITGLVAPPTTPGLNTVRDFQVNPNGGGQYYVLYDNGYIFSGSAIGGSGYDPVWTTPRSPGGYGPQPSGAPGLATGGTPPSGTGYVWMHVAWDEGWIIALDANGGTWGYYLFSNAYSTGKPIPGLPNPSPLGSSGRFWEGRGAIVPQRNPARFWMLGSTGTVVGVAITGTIQALNPTFGAGSGTTPTETTRPTLTWTFDEQLSGVHLGAQKSYSVRIYPQAVTQAAGFVAGQNAGTDWINDKAQLVEAVGTGSDKFGRDLQNGSVYVAYVKVTDTALQESPWNRLGGVSGTFTMAIPAPTPSSFTLTATPHPGGAYPPIQLGKVTLAAGSTVSGGDLFQYQVSVEGASWVNVLGGEATTAATIDHTIAPTNVNLQYRVRKFKRVPGLVAGPWQLSNVTLLTQPAGTPSGWRLIDPNSIGGPSNPLVVPLSIVADSYSLERTEPRGEFQPITSDFMVVESAGVKGTIHTLTVQVLTRADYQALWGILGIERSVIFQTVFGQQWWVRATPGTYRTLLAAPLSSESIGIRHAHRVELRFVETGPAIP